MEKLYFDCFEVDEAVDLYGKIKDKTFFTDRAKSRAGVSLLRPRHLSRKTLSFRYFPPVSLSVDINRKNICPDRKKTGPVPKKTVPVPKKTGPVPKKTAISNKKPNKKPFLASAKKKIYFKIGFQDMI